MHNLPGLANQANGPYGFWKAVREKIRSGADFIKLANDRQDLTQEELSAAVDETHRLGEKVACHTIWHPSQRMAIDLAVEKGIAWTSTINMSHQYLKWFQQQMNHSDPSLARSAREGYARQMEYLERKHASMEYALKAGLKAVTGTDSFMREVRFDAVPDEMCCLVE